MSPVLVRTYDASLMHACEAAVHAEIGSQVSPASTTPLLQTDAAQVVNEPQPPDGHGVASGTMHRPLELHEGAGVKEPATHEALPHVAPVVILQPLTPSQVPSWQLAGVVPQAESVRPEFFCVHPDPSFLQA